MSAIDVDETGEGTLGGGSIEDQIDARSLQASLDGQQIERNRAQGAAFRAYVQKVVKESGVRDSQLTRRLASTVAGIVARLPFVPDDKEEIEPGKTEYDFQIERTAKQAEDQLGSEAVWTVSARKIARAALDLRKKDPDGTKGIALVQPAFDTPREQRVPSAFKAQVDRG